MVVKKNLDSTGKESPSIVFQNTLEKNKSVQFEISINFVEEANKVTDDKKQKDQTKKGTPKKETPKKLRKTDSQTTPKTVPKKESESSKTA